MANTKQAKKRAEQSIRRRDRNRSVKTSTRGAVRALRSAAETGKPEESAALLGQLNEFLKLVEQMSAVDTAGVEPL